MNDFAVLQNWDEAYSNRDAVANSSALIDAWGQKSAVFRAEKNGVLDIAYGDNARQIYDLFLPDSATPRGLLVYIHGGYWMAMSKDQSSYCAAGPLALGFAVAVINYPLCPHVTLPKIADDVAAAIRAAATRVDGPLFVAGHSAGGHLSALMACEEGPLDAAIRGRLAGTLMISGLFDLRPLMKTSLNDTLHITEEIARSESPALLTPLAHVAHGIFCGAEELPEFLRQSALLANIWSGLGIALTHYELAGENHFTIPDLLANPQSRLCQTLTQIDNKL